MKAHIPYQHQNKRNAENYAVMQLFLYISAYALSKEFGFGEKRLYKYAETFSGFVKESEKNKTWVDELRHWAKENGIDRIFE